MPNTVVIGKKAAQFLAELSDEKLRLRLQSKIDALAQHPAVANVKKIQGSLLAYRLRVGDYRIIYEYTPNFVMVTAIGLRKDIYR